MCVKTTLTRGFLTFGIMADGVAGHPGTTSGPPRDHLGGPQKNTDLRIWDPESHPLRRIYILFFELSFCQEAS